MAAPRQNFAQGSVTATGVICTLGVEGFKHFCSIVGGTFVGTVVIEVSNDATTWAPLGSSLTAPGSDPRQNLPVKFVRLRCSAFTSGTIVGMIGATE